MGKNNNDTHNDTEQNRNGTVRRSISLPAELDERVREANINLSGLTTELVEEEMDLREATRAAEGDTI